MQIYDIIDDILLKKSGGVLHTTEEFNKSMSVYMVCRYLSMKSTTIVYATLLNKYQSTLTPSQVYTWLYDIIPKQHSGFIPYLKRQAKPKPKADIIPVCPVRSYLANL